MKELREKAVRWWMSLPKDEKDQRYPEDLFDPYMPNEIEYFYKSDIQVKRENKINQILDEN